MTSGLVTTHTESTPIRLGLLFQLPHQCPSYPPSVVPVVDYQFPYLAPETPIGGDVKGELHTAHDIRVRGRIPVLVQAFQWRFLRLQSRDPHHNAARPMSGCYRLCVASEQMNCF